MQAEVCWAQTARSTGLLVSGLAPQDRCDDLELAAAVRAVLQVEIEQPLEQLGPARAHRSVVRTVRVALGRSCCLRGRLRLLRHHLWHHQRPQPGVGCQRAVVRAAGGRALARRGLQGHAAACSGLSTRASSESPPLSAMVVDPSSSTSTPRRVSSFIVRVMILCNTVCSAASAGAGTSTNSGAPSVPRRCTPSSTRPCR